MGTAGGAAAPAAARGGRGRPRPARRPAGPPMLLPLLPLLLLAAPAAARAKGPDPAHGAPPDRAPAYRAAAFRCDAGGTELPSTALNDGFCDCEDGTDEPGTAACPAGRFFCPHQDAAHRRFVPSAQVGDGHCDCCDCADEPPGTGKVSCKAEKRRQEAAARHQQFLGRAAKAREEMVEESKELLDAETQFLDVEWVTVQLDEKVRSAPFAQSPRSPLPAAPPDATRAQAQEAHYLFQLLQFYEQSLRAKERSGPNFERKQQLLRADEATTPRQPGQLWVNDTEPVDMLPPYKYWGGYTCLDLGSQILRDGEYSEEAHAERETFANECLDWRVKFMPMYREKGYSTKSRTESGTFSERGGVALSSFTENLVSAYEDEWLLAMSPRNVRVLHKLAKQREEKLKRAFKSMQEKKAHMASAFGGLPGDWKHVYYFIYDECLDHHSEDLVHTICPFTEIRRLDKKAREVTILGRHGQLRDLGAHMTFIGGDECKVDGEAVDGVFEGFTLRFECGRSTKISKVARPGPCKTEAVYQAPVFCLDEAEAELFRGLREDLRVEAAAKKKAQESWGDLAEVEDFSGKTEL